MDIDISIFQGVSKKTGAPYKALEVKVGKWRKLLFLTEFELDYISDILIKYKK